MAQPHFLTRRLGRLSFENLIRRHYCISPERKIISPIFIFKVMVDFIYNLLAIHLDFQACHQPKKNRVHKWSNLHERCAMSWNEWKINFPIFELLSTLYSKFFENLPIWSTKTTISQKLKITLIGNWIFY